MKIIIGPSGVRALPLAAGINEGGHYFSRPTAQSAEGLLQVDCVYLSDYVSILSHISSPVIGRRGSWGLSHLAWVQ